jgi:hypothetical protein
MPLFIAGFVFTAGPRWLRRPPVAARLLRLPVGLFIAGWGVAVVGFHLTLTLAAAGLALVAFGWGALTWPILRWVAGSTQADGWHPRLIASACSVIVVCLALSSLLLAGGRTELIQPLLRVALWCGVSLVFLAASHRLLPFLGAGIWPALDARWPTWRPWRRCACGSRCAGCACRPCGSRWSRCCSASSCGGTLRCGSALPPGYQPWTRAPWRRSTWPPFMRWASATSAARCRSWPRA